MKLNIGCGPFYKKGYVNIDPYEKKVADEFYYSWLLPYKDNSVAEVASSQLLEHLGYTEALYSLSEWYRVLKNNGKLFIETVDLEKTLRNKPIDKNWLFGLDSQGMTHKYCFDEKELVDLLAKIGFNSIQVNKKNFNNKPILQIEAIKIPDDNRLLISQFRRRLLEKKFINLKRINRSDSAYEEILEKIFEILEKKESNRKKIIELLKLISVFNPKVSRLFFSLLIESGMIFSKNRKDLEKAIEISQALESDQLPAYLIYLFYKTKKATSLSTVVFDRIKSIAQQYVEGLFCNPDKNKLLPLKLIIFNHPHLPKFFLKIRNFSILNLKEASFLYEARGVKYFAQGKFFQAINFFQKSLRFNPENFFSYWNLARLYLINKDIPRAIISYERAFEVTPKNFRSELIKEIKDVTRNHKENKYLGVKENVYY